MTHVYININIYIIIMLLTQSAYRQVICMLNIFTANNFKLPCCKILGNGSFCTISFCSKLLVSRFKITSHKQECEIINFLYFHTILLLQFFLDLYADLLHSYILFQLILHIKQYCEIFLPK